MQATDVALVLYNRSLICLLALNPYSAQHLFKGCNDVQVSNCGKSKPEQQQQQQQQQLISCQAHMRGVSCAEVGKIDSRCCNVQEGVTSPESMDSSVRQLPRSSTMSHVALPGSTTTTSPGTSRREDTALLTDRHQQCQQ